MNLEDLLSNVAIHPVTRCWNWKGKRTGRGYGFIDEGKTIISCHRLAYELAKGQIPIGLEIDHLCKNKQCCNPEHLEAVTHAENTRRGMQEVKRVISLVCKYGHTLNGKRTRNGGGRYCKTCVKDSKRRQRA